MIAIVGMVVSGGVIVASSAYEIIMFYKIMTGF